MSEEEIIKELKEFVISAQKEENFIYYSQYKYENELADIVQGLLDLYNKEKEKNKELEKTILEFANDRERILKTPVISKDKIREKIKEVQNIKKEVEKLTDNKMKWNETLRLDSKIIVLEELLEE